jgi:multidrug efflux pump subunit AcrA (membrane-fusion protein)
MMTVASRETNPKRASDLKQGAALLTPSPRPEGEYFRELLTQAIDATGAVAAAAWGLTPEGVLAQIAAIRFAETEPAQSAAAARQHVQLLLQVLHSGRERVFRGETMVETSSQPPLVLLAPLVHRRECVGVIEVFLRRETSDEELAGHLAALKGLSELATPPLEGRSQIRSGQPADEFPRRLIAFIQQLHRHLRVDSVAMTTVNEGRLLLGCERASLVVVRGMKTDVVAISGQDRVRERSNLVRGMKELASLVMTTGQPLHYDGALKELPQPVQGPLVTYLAESSAVRLTVLPLYAPPASAEEGEACEVSDALGALLLESFSAEMAEVSAQKEQAVAAQAAQALHNALVFEGAFLSPLWRFFNRRLSRAERATRRRRGLCAVCACLGLAILLAMPVPYYVSAKGQLLPVVHLGVFAPEDGEVVEVAARGGERIEKGQLLVRLRNDALTAEHLQARNRLTESERSLAALIAQRGEAVENGIRDAAIRLEGRIAQTKIEIEGLRVRLASLERELSRLEVRSLVSGTVATFQPTQQLLNRPVRRGELLLEVMHESGPWQLKLEIPAHRVGHVLAARGDGRPKLAASATGDGRTQLAASAAGDARTELAALATEDDRDLRLPVRFTLATEPETTFEGVVYRLGTRVDAAEDGTPVLPAHATIHAAEIPLRMSGTQAFARIYCGRKSFAYWLFGDAIDFVRRRMW